MTDGFVRIPFCFVHHVSTSFLAGLIQQQADRGQQMSLSKWNPYFNNLPKGKAHPTCLARTCLGRLELFTDGRSMHISSVICSIKDFDNSVTIAECKMNKNANSNRDWY